jgi:hypothetical protein
MAKELPYFRFTASEWLNDDISLESYAHKGAFIDFCAYYWSQDCDVTLEKLKKKFSNATSLLKDLISIGVIKHENKHDKIKIDFLNIQYDLLSEKRKLRQVAGSKGGNAKAKLKQKLSYKYKDNNKDKNNNKDIPLFEDFLKYAVSKKPNVDSEKIALKYSSWVENNWHDGNDNKITNWKTKLLNTLPHIDEVKKKYDPSNPNQMHY